MAFATEWESLYSAQRHVVFGPGRTLFRFFKVLRVGHDGGSFWKLVAGQVLYSFFSQLGWIIGC